MSGVSIDITRLLGRLARHRLPTGIDRVCQLYVERFGGTARAVVQASGWRRVLSHGASQQLFGLILAPDDAFRRRSRALIACDVMLRPWGPLGEAAGTFCLNVGHTGLDAAGYGDWLSRHALRPIFLVHDLIPITHPEFCRAGEAVRHARRMQTVVRHAAGVIANSQDTLDALARFAHGLDLPLPPSQVALLAPARLPAPALQRPLDVPYFVMLGTIEARKNHWMLLQVWRQLVATLGGQAPRLVIVGQRGWECENVFDLLDRSEALRGFVHEKPGCSDAELATWLGHAQALLFPSFVEGFGMPLVEALAAGTPVVASALPVFREIAGDVPDYLDPLDGPGWAAAVTDYARPDSARRTAQIGRMEGFRAPTWEAHFAQVDALLERLR